MPFLNDTELKWLGKQIAINDSSNMKEGEWVPRCAMVQEAASLMIRVHGYGVNYKTGEIYKREVLK